MRQMTVCPSLFGNKTVKNILSVIPGKKFRIVYCLQLIVMVEKDIKGKNKMGKKKNTLIFIIVAVALIIATVVIIALTIGGGSKSYNDQLALGIKYLDELDYDKALAAYREAIDIEPEKPDAYAGLTDVYLAWAGSQNVNVQALKILENGVEELKSYEENASLIEIIEKYIVRIQSEMEKYQDDDSEDDVVDDHGSDEDQEDGVEKELRKLSEEIGLERRHEDSAQFLGENPPGAMYITLEERKAIFQPIAEKCEAYIRAYIELYGTEEIDIGRELHLNQYGDYMYVHASESITQVYDFLNYCYRQMEDMDKAWKLRQEQAEYAGKTDILNGFTDTEENYINHYDEYGRIVYKESTSDSYGDWIWVYGIGNRIEEFQLGSITKYTYDEQGRISGWTKQLENGKTQKRTIDFPSPGTAIQERHTYKIIYGYAIIEEF